MIKANNYTLISSEIYLLNILYRYFIYKAKSDDNRINKIIKAPSKSPKPFVKWVGGKRQLIKQFREIGIYPPKSFNKFNNSYYEPFVGGGAIFFDLLPNNAILSDMNLELVIAYNVIRDEVDKLILSLKKHVYTKEYYLYLRSLNIDTLSNVEIASRFIYLNRTGFNGMYRVNKSGKFNVPFGKYSNPNICDEPNLISVSKALKNAVITHLDYKQILNSAQKGDFIYFDPPYYPISKSSSFTSYTSESFLEKEQLELKDTYIELHKRGCFVMLSNSHSEFIIKIYSNLKGVKIHKIDAKRLINANAANRGKIKEVVITNY